MLLLLQAAVRRLISTQFTTSYYCISSRYRRMASILPRLPVFEAISNHNPQSLAVVQSKSGECYTYGGLLKDVADASNILRRSAGSLSLDGQRIAFLVENSYRYVVTFLSILGSNSIAVPLSSSFPASELRYIINNSNASILLTSDNLQDKAKEVIKEGLGSQPILVTVDQRPPSSGSNEHVQLDTVHVNAGGMMLYTSGTTSRPKGVLLPENVLTAQAQSLVKAWEYSTEDVLLHVLPLHHIHGTVNALLAPLFAGSTIEFLYPFNVNDVWERLASPYLPGELQSSRSCKKITFLTAVPTIYNRLLSSHNDLPSPMSEATKKALIPENLRLNISGSAALPTPTKTAWTKLSGGNILLERYGMTEVGMALSCGLDPKDRVDGSVGWPLPFVEARLVDTETNEIIEVGEETAADGKEREGEIQLRGPTVFQEYWCNPKATSEEFVEGEDGNGRWFKTGDIATRRHVDGAGQSRQDWASGPMYFIRGRKSVDIIKSGGEKISALEVERELLSLPQIAEAAVVGLHSEQWGQKVAAVVVLNPKHAQSGRGGKNWGIMDMRRALKDQLVNYKIPQEMKVVEELPKNAMGKINKKSLIKELFANTT